MDKIELNKGYALIDVIYHRISDKHIPYICGCMVQGPKGGKYILDNFGLGALFRYFNITTKQGVECRVLDKNREVKIISECLTFDKDLSSGKTNEECIKKYAKTHNYKVISRKEALALVDKIRKG